MSDPSPEMVTLAESLAAVLARPAPAAEPAAAVATPAPEIPATAVPAEAVAAATPAPGQLPAGLLSVAEVEEYERNPPSGLSYAKRMELSERYIKSAEHHMKEGTI
jgi:hypothetical protein